MDEAFNRNKKGKEKEFVKEVEGVGKRNKRGYIYINIYIYIYIYRERERERERASFVEIYGLKFLIFSKHTTS